MAPNIIYRTQLLRRVNTCLLCSKASLDSTNNNTTSEEPALPKEKAPKRKRQGTLRKHSREINKFFEENPTITRSKQFVPSKILNTRTYKNPEYLYLICPKIAQNIAEHVWQRLAGKDQAIGESSPGFGLVSEFLLQKKATSIKLYENNSEFYEYLREVFQHNCEVTLYNKDLFSLGKYAYIDRQDQGERVSQLLSGIPKKSWTDDPFITMIGTNSNKSFLMYLVTSIVLQREISTYGRINLFLITFENVWKLFSEGIDDCPVFQKGASVLLQTFFEAELIDKYPRKFFLPWQHSKERKVKSRASALDTEHLYLINVTMKKDFPLIADEFVPFYCFIKALLGRGNTSVIATCEKWVPECGKSLLVPKLSHDDYFQDMDIFTKFKELNSAQITSVFRELIADPNYPNSPFLDLVEQEWMKAETIETYI